MSSKTSDVIVVGGGPVGLIAAIALARRGAHATLLAPRPPHTDRRTTALLGRSVEILKELDVWNSVAAKTAPLRKLRLVDGTRRLVRSPEVLFDAAEIDLEAFGYNIENEILIAAMRDALPKFGNLQVIERAAADVMIDGERANIRLDDGSALSTKLIVAADGRNSICRAAANIATTKRPLPQTAIALNLKHTRPHRDTSTEFHTASGPFTLVPLSGLRSSLVWVGSAQDAERVRATSDVELAREIEVKSYSILGEVSVDGPRGIFPLAIEIADRFAGSRILLVGEAGHVLPPIGAQGLNLSIRDAEAAGRLTGEALAKDRDPGSESVHSAYEVERRADIRARTAAVELLGRSLITDLLPVHLARGLGLEFASRIPFLRKTLMRGGLGGTKRAETA